MGEIRLIALEGLDGAGKTIQAKRLAEALGVEYIKGGGWLSDSKLAKRAERLRSDRDWNFSLMQLSLLREIRKRLSNKKEGIVGVVDRLVLVDVAHHLSKSWDGRGFPEEKKLWAQQALSEYIPEGVLGIVLDTDKDILRERISKRGTIDVTESDTLNRFEAKRAAWLACVEMLNWKVISAEGSESEVYKRIMEFLGEKGISPEGQSAGKEVR